MERSRTAGQDRAAARRVLDFGIRTRRAALAHERGRLWAIRASLVAPVRAARVALRAVRAYGWLTQQDAGVSLSRQFYWTWWLNLRHDYEPYTTYRFRLFSRNRVLPTPGFAQWTDMEPLFILVARCAAPEAAATLADKRRFATWCAEQGIPSPTILMEFENGQARWRALAEGETPRTDLFAKWGTDYGGNDTTAWRYDGEQWVGPDGVCCCFDEIVTSLSERSRRGVVLLQSRLVNHAALRDLSPSALSTVRVMTTCRPGGAPRFLVGVLRMGTGSASADNFAQGGIASTVDPASGVIGPARGLDKQHRTHVHETHPDTHAIIAGRQVPFWEESVRLAVDAHERLGPIACVGWDVAVLQDGPVLLEGNWNPSTKLLQVATQTPLLATEFADVFAEWLAEPACIVDDRELVKQASWSPV